MLQQVSSLYLNSFFFFFFFVKVSCFFASLLTKICNLLLKNIESLELFISLPAALCSQPVGQRDL